MEGQMKYILAFILILAVVAIANQFYVLGVSVILLTVLAIFFFKKIGEEIVNMYLGMPTVWQNIQETLEIGFKFGAIGDITNLHSVCIFYNKMQACDSFFEIKVSEQLVNSFESKHGIPPLLEKRSIRNRALHYFVDAAMFNPERLPEILNAVQVRKKVGGKKQDPEKEVSMELQPIYAI